MNGCGCGYGYGPGPGPYDYYGAGACPAWIDYIPDVYYSDDDIADMVVDNIDLDPNIPRRDRESIEVEVKDGIVTLRGTVRNRRSKINAYTDAFWTSGVIDVDSEIKVEERKEQEKR